MGTVDRESPRSLATIDRQSIDYVLTTTRAVRRRLDVNRPVDPNVIVECIELGLQAPQGSDAEGLRWIVVTDPDKRGAVANEYIAGITDVGNPSIQSYRAANFENLAARDAGQQAKMGASVQHLSSIIKDVPVLVLPCYRAALPERSDMFVASSIFGSSYPAVWSFQLALRSRGLVSVLTTAHLTRADRVAEILEIPAGVTQVALIPVAHPIGTEFRVARRGSVEDKVGWNSWDCLHGDGDSV